MRLHIRSFLTSDMDDVNGDVIAIRSRGLTQPHNHEAAIFQDCWTLHLLGDGTADLHCHSVASESITDTHPHPEAAWAKRAYELLKKELVETA